MRLNFYVARAILGLFLSEGVPGASKHWPVGVRTHENLCFATRSSSKKGRNGRILSAKAARRASLAHNEGYGLVEPSGVV